MDFHFDLLLSVSLPTKEGIIIQVFIAIIEGIIIPMINYIPVIVI